MLFELPLPVRVMSQRQTHLGSETSAENDNEVVFSYIDGLVWMSWPGDERRVSVGSYEAAVAAMRDFLAQCDLGERLARTD